MTPEQLNKEEKLSTIIELCNEIDIDGETLEYIIQALGMETQMLRQLIMTAPISSVQELVYEKTMYEKTLLELELRMQKPE